MSAAFVPTYTRTLTLEGRERSWQLANSVINALLLYLGSLIVSNLQIDNFWWALLFSFVVSIIVSILEGFDKKANKRES